MSSIEDVGYGILFPISGRMLGVDLKEAMKLDCPQVRNMLVDVGVHQCLPHADHSSSYYSSCSYQPQKQRWHSLCLLNNHVSFFETNSHIQFYWNDL